MNNVLRLLLVGLFSLPVIFSSCRKDDTNCDPANYPAYMIVGVTFQPCDIFENYDPDAVLYGGWQKLWIDVNRDGDPDLEIESIDDLDTFNNPKKATIRTLHDGIEISTVYSTTDIVVHQQNDTISFSSTNWSQGKNYLASNTSSGGLWNNQHQKYAVFRFVDGSNNVLYGWIKLSVVYNHKVTIHEYATIHVNE
jgi:hypothetical protein